VTNILVDKEVKNALKWSTVIGALMIVAGIVAIAVPLAAGIAVNLLVAWLLVFCGLAHLLFGWHNRSVGATLWEVLLGLLYVGIGSYLLFKPLVGLAALTLALAGFLLFEAAFEIALFFQLRQHRGSGWIVFDGLITLALAVMIWLSWPSSSEWAIGTLIGISMLFSGISRAMWSQAARRLANTG